MTSQLRTPDQLHDYQKRAVNHQCTHPQTAMWMDAGLGKTGATLTSIVHLINTGFLKAVIIVAPIRVCRLVWRQEALRWGHTKHLRFNMVMGDKDQRTRALMKDADVYITNYENLQWISETLDTYFISKNRPLPFNGVVFDEVSKMKTSTTHRVKAFMKIHSHFKWSTGLTGTPASNGYKDLHGQFLVLDGGVRLGKSKTQFQTRFYRKVGQYKEIMIEGAEEVIKQAIGDMTIEMSAEDYLKMPDLIVNDIEVELPPDVRIKYDQMEKDFFIQLDNGAEKEMFNQASLTNACLQVSNGAIYPVAGMPLWEPVHDAKLDALDDLIEESGGQPILCMYAYRSDAARIMNKFGDKKKYPGLNPINLTECKSEAALKNAMYAWENGDCRLMVGHAACLGKDTQVFTQRNGWTTITDVSPDDLVFDGVEFVKHDGCSYSGYKDVIDVFGITMTPDHKLLIDGQWVEAKDVRDCQETRYEALRLGDQISNCSVSTMSDMWCGVGNASSERDEEQSKKTDALFSLHQRYLSPSDRNSNISNLAWNEKPSTRYYGQKLRRSWDNCLSRVGEFCNVLQRYVIDIFRGFNYRADRQQQTLLQVELPMGYQHGAAIQQTKQSLCNVSRTGYPFGGTLSQDWVEQNGDSAKVGSRSDSGRSCFGRREFLVSKTNDVSGGSYALGGNLSSVGSRENSIDYSPSTRDVSRRSSNGCEEFSPIRQVQTNKAHVFDLVNCGPRHRFVIRNPNGEVFISHNSIGHGLDGLQRNGNIIVWFGLTWSLELYSQAVSRLHRQGQGKPVFCHRILCTDTLDQAQSLALNDKADNQAALRNAVKNYRLSKQK